MSSDPAFPNRRCLRLKGYDYAQAGAYFLTICTQARRCLFGEVTNGVMQLNDAGLMVLAQWNELPRRFPGIELDACVVMPNHVHGIIVLTPVGPGLAPGKHEASPNPGDHKGRPYNHIARPHDIARPDEIAPPDHIAQPDRITRSNQVAPPNQNRLGQPVGAGLVPARNLAPGLHKAISNRGDHADRGDPKPGDHKGRPYIGRGRAPTVGGVVGAFKSTVTVLYGHGVKRCAWPALRGRLWQRNYYEHIIRNEDALGRMREYIANNPAQWAQDDENPANRASG